MTNTTLTEFDRVLSDLDTARRRAAELATAAFLAAWDATGIADGYALIHTPDDDNESRSITSVASFTLDDDEKIVEVNEGTRIHALATAYRGPLARALEHLPLEALWETAVAEQTEDRKYGGWQHYISIAELRAREETNR